ncbi:carbonate dehydratase [Ammoniphilus sp. YIM 78166]|uniref:carbonate dehydratase n=1 Tax=Ammoniphilus sp. YIM 78166 TaxID=1644106 RepID=UPI00106F4B17|nr:carbonate dehydratase [Ammoniphilus sp. YIM 78166]
MRNSPGGGIWGPMNAIVRFIGPNPSTTFNPNSLHPSIDDQVFLSPFTYVVGDVRIHKNVYIGPFVSIRADEGTPFHIGENSNIQDGVILHGIRDEFIEKNNQRFSIYIGEDVTCAHGSIVHGPCLIEDEVFIGFQSTVFNASVGEGVYIASGAVVTNGVRVAPHRFVPPGASIDTQEKADSLSYVPQDKDEFAKQVQRVNQEFPTSYSLLLGKRRCSCGIASG